MQIGSILQDRYQIFQKIGSGGQASIYKAYDSKSKRIVCLKVCNKNENFGLIQNDMIENEAQILKKLSHDNIVKFYDIIKTEEVIVLVLEYIEGISFSQLIDIQFRNHITSKQGFNEKRMFEFLKQHEDDSNIRYLYHSEIRKLLDYASQKFPDMNEFQLNVDEIQKYYPKETIAPCLYVDALAHILTHLFEVLQYLSQKSLIHRDLKPDNILVTVKNGKMDIKIIDFGFATKEKDACTALGTPGYIAPEVETCGDVLSYNCKADLWSTGAIIFISLMGINPFVIGRNEHFHEIQVKYGLFLPLSPLVPQFFNDLIQNLLVMEPFERWNAARAQSYFLSQLDQIKACTMRQMYSQRFAPKKKQSTTQINTVLVGDLKIGKTSLIKNFTQKQEVTEHTDSYVLAGEELVHMIFTDTMGTEGRNYSLIGQIYRNQQLCLLCFNKSNQKSFENVEFWQQQVKRCTPNPILFVLVGINGTGECAIQQAEIDELCKQLSCRYFEMAPSDAKNMLDEVVQFAMEQEIGVKQEERVEVIQHNRPKRKFKGMCQ